MCRNPRYRRGPELDTQKLARTGVPILRERSTLLRVLRPLRLRDELARSFQSDPAGIGTASFDAMRKVVAGQIGR